MSLVKRAVVCENLKIQRNDEPVAKCSRDRGIRLGFRYGATCAKPNFYSVFRLDAAYVAFVLSLSVSQMSLFLSFYFHRNLLYLPEVVDIGTVVILTTI